MTKSSVKIIFFIILNLGVRREIKFLPVWNLYLSGCEKNFSKSSLVVKPVYRKMNLNGCYTLKLIHCYKAYLPFIQFF